MGEIKGANISLIKSYRKDFKGEYDNFNNVTYNTFSSSYLKKCTDSCVSKLVSELQTHYDKINTGYMNVNKWWTDYNKNLENLENYLSGSVGLGAISEVSVRNYVSSNFWELKNYTIPFVDVFDSSVLVAESSNVVFSSSGTSNSFDVGAVTGETVGVWDSVSDWWDDVSNWWDNTAEPAIKMAYEVCCDVVSSVCATVGTGVFSLIEGFYRIGETIIDLVMMVGTSVASVVTGLIDSGQAIYGAVTGNEWTSLTKSMWEDTRAYVFKQHISGMHDSFYEDTLVGQWFVENAYGFETVRSIGSGVGCCAGVVILTIATLGFGGGVASTAAMTAATSVSSTVGFVDTITRMSEEEIRNNFNENFNKLLDGISDWRDDISNWWDNAAEPAIKRAYEVCCDVVSSVCATVGTGVISLVEGILQFGEAIVDFVLLLDTAMKSVGTVVIDGVQAIYGAVTGNEWTSVTKKMWENTKGFVSEQYVTGWFDSFYEDTFVGQWISENAYGFETVRSIGSGIGYTAGVVILTIFTFGAGGAVASGGAVSAATMASATTAGNMAMVAGAAGVGKGTQNAWAEGAGIVEGLGTGVATGLWEGIQYYLGGKIGKLDLFGAEKLFKISGTSEGTLKLLNGLGRVILDGVDGGLEGIVQPFINSVYKDSYFDESKNEYVKFDESASFGDRYKELWNDNGGWGGVLTEAAVGSGSSLLGEAFDLRKYFKDQNVVDEVGIDKTKFLGKSITDKVNYLSLAPRQNVIDLLCVLDDNQIYDLFNSTDVDINIKAKLLDCMNLEQSKLCVSNLDNNTIKDIAEIQCGTNLLLSVPKNMQEFILSFGYVDAKSINECLKNGSLDSDFVLKNIDNNLLSEMILKSNGCDTDLSFKFIYNLCSQDDIERAKFVFLNLDKVQLNGVLKMFYDKAPDSINIFMQFVFKDELDIILNNLTDSDLLCYFYKYSPLGKDVFLSKIDETQLKSMFFKLSEFERENIFLKKLSIEQSKLLLSDMDVDSFKIFMKQFYSEEEFLKTFYSISNDDLLKVWTTEMSKWSSSLFPKVISQLIGQGVDVSCILKFCDDDVIAKLSSNLIIKYNLNILNFITDEIQLRNVVNKLKVSDLGLLVASELDNGNNLNILLKAMDNDTIIEVLETLDSEKILPILKQLDINQLDYVRNNLEGTLKITLATQYNIRDFYEPRIANLIDFADNDMVSNFKKNFGLYVNYDRLAQLKGTYKFLNQERFKKLKNVNELTMAFNNGHYSTMNLNYGDSLLWCNISHESIHQLSANDVIDLNGNFHSRRGLSIDRQNVGINECVTEYLNELSMGDNYYTKLTGEIYCGYQDGVIKLKQLIDLGVIEQDKLIQAYFSNNIDYIKDAVTSIGGEGMFEKLMLSFNDVINGDAEVVKKALVELEALIGNLRILK